MGVLLIMKLGRKNENEGDTRIVRVILIGEFFPQFFDILFAQSCTNMCAGVSYVIITRWFLEQYRPSFLEKQTNNG